MKKKVPFLILLLVFFTSIAFSQNNPVPVTVRGKVTSEGKGIAGVAVTDGISVVDTDRKGNYTLNTTTGQKFVYYSLPSGYESPKQKGIPVFYSALDSVSKKQRVNFEILKASRNQQTHAFITWADPQVLDTSELVLLREVAQDVKQTANGLSDSMPVHGISCGDIVFDRLELFDPYKDVVSITGIPFYQSIGNHDMNYNRRSDELSVRSYNSAFGPAYYSFNVGNIHYITLKNVFYYGDSYLYFGYLDETQLQWLERDLSRVKKNSTVVINMHIPSKYGDAEKAAYMSLFRNSLMNREALYKLLAPFNTHILAGHSHTQWNTIIAPNIMEHVHAAASGAWWQGDIATDGSPKGYTVYEVRGDSISWYFKGINSSRNEQLKIYPPGADSTLPGQLIANVYNYDPQWKVSWYEDDRYMGDMEQYWGVDPLAARTYIPGTNKKHSWLSAGQTNHLFRAKIQDSNAHIKVVVTDRFGNRYEESLSTKNNSK